MRETLPLVLQMKPSSLKNRRVLLAVTGGIAAYKIPDLVRRLRERGADVAVIMTETASQFIPPLTLQTVSGNPVYSDPFESPLVHIELPRESDIFVVAPATANMIAKMASGLSDDLVSLSFLAFRGPVLVVPAMNHRMYEHHAVRRNLGLLKDMGVFVLEPGEGALACEEEGKGRMPDTGSILSRIEALLSPQDLAGIRVVVTAGPTREYLDPVRFISNRSSGKMGYALASVASRRGAEVTLISGPVSLVPPEGLSEYVRVEDTAGMLQEVLRAVGKGADLLLMAAAVADFRPAGYSSRKIGKEGLPELSLERTPDIISEVSSMRGHPFIIGFSAETGPEIAKAREEMFRKGMDAVVFNDVTEEGAGFDHDTNRITIIDSEGTRDYPLMHKEDCAERIIDYYLEIKRNRSR